MIEESEKRLREYIENDKIYQDYKNNGKEPSDFERFCFVHCRDIENVLNELEQLKEELQKADSITQSCIFNGKKESELNFRQSLNLVKELRQENQQLKEQLKDEENWRVKIAKENSSNVSECLKLIEQKKQYKSVLDEIREYIKENYNLNWYVESCYKDDLLQILDKVGSNE